MNRFLWLFALVVIAALVLRALPRASSHDSAGRVPAARVQVLWRLEIRDGRLVPDVLSASGNSKAQLRIINFDSRPHLLRLLGYEDLLPEVRVPAADSVSRFVILERPGEDLAMELDGRRAARVAVLGSHMVGDHR